MTPLMRAVQKNSVDCVAFLLNETDSNPNGSLQSTYTPIWFAISNGFNVLAKLLLNFNASPSILERPITKTGDHIDNGVSLTLFSPLRAAIVYGRLEIMLLLLKYGANLNELFDDCLNNDSEEEMSPIHKRYLNALHFFHRQLSNRSPSTSDNGNSNKNQFLDILNNYICNVNVYRRMVISFVYYTCLNIKSDKNLMDGFDEFCYKFGRNSIEKVVNATNSIEASTLNGMSLDQYLEMCGEFFTSLDMFTASDIFDRYHLNNLHFNTRYLKLNRLTNYHSNIFEFSTSLLMVNYFKPKTLKELCRFKLRNKLFNSMNTTFRYNSTFLKCDHFVEIVNQLGLPNSIKNYLLMEELGNDKVKNYQFK
jgi:hypothetical protein